jgi:3D (Asp-Asp-Asp) domain-containing protein
MRSGLLKDTDKRFRTRTFDIIAVMLIFTAIIVSLILIFSTLNTLLMMSTDTLNKLNDVSMELDELSIDTMQENRSTGQIEALGTFTVTHYCSCPKCCGEWSDGITATGTHAAEGRTIAVDPSVIPLGTEVEIDGVGTFIAEDVGGAIKGNKIDIFCESHETAIQRGKFEREVRYEPPMR